MTVSRIRTSSTCYVGLALGSSQYFLIDKTFDEIVITNKRGQKWAQKKQFEAFSKVESNLIHVAHINTITHSLSLSHRHILSYLNLGYKEFIARIIFIDNPVRNLHISIGICMYEMILKYLTHFMVLWLMMLFETTKDLHFINFNKK